MSGNKSGFRRPQEPGTPMNPASRELCAASEALFLQKKALLSSSQKGELGPRPVLHLDHFTTFAMLEYPCGRTPAIQAKHLNFQPVPVVTQETLVLTHTCSLNQPLLVLLV